MNDRKLSAIMSILACVGIVLLILSNGRKELIVVAYILIFCGSLFFGNLLNILFKK